MRSKNIVALILYYGFARYLPRSCNSTISKKIRRFLCKKLFKKSGQNINIERNANFGNGLDIEIGDNSGIGLNCSISGPVKIGKNVMMGPEVCIITQNHRYERIDIPMIKQGSSQIMPVIIDDDVWIGMRAVILPGIHISQGSVVGSGSVVTKDVPGFAIVGGNPAKILKYRIKK